MIEKYIITDHLPQRKNGVGVDWEKCSGLSVPFKYRELIGEFIIVKYDKKNKRIYFKYNDELMDANITSFKNCSLGVNLKMLSRKDNINFKFNIGDIINKGLYDLEIIDRKVKVDKGKDGYARYNKMYKIKCGRCGKSKWRVESNVLKYGCSPCTQATMNINDYNNIPDNAPWMIKYFQGGIEEAINYSIRSNQYINPICPDCGRIKKNKIQITSIYENHSIGCVCSDKVSYPEKFMYNVLEQLNVDFKWQLSKRDFDWCEDYRYDFYIKNKNIIVETHGNQHINIDGWIITKEEQQIIDKCKKELALNNNIDKYITIDCAESNMEYIKENIIKSELSKIYDMSSINWDEADEFALSNFIKYVCEYFENNKENLLMKDIQNNLKISNTTLVRYLKKGNKHSWCKYDPREIRNAIFTKKDYENCKNVYFRELDTVFKSARQIADMSEELLGVKLSRAKIQAVCIGKYDTHKGFHFEYCNDEIPISNINEVKNTIPKDWLKYSNNFTTSELIKEICKYYEEHKDNVLMKDIADKFNIGMMSLIKWLKIGKENGICSYIPSK